MIVPDVNLAVYAYNTDAPNHRDARAYWEDLLQGLEAVGIADVVILGFVRITTRPKPLIRPLTGAEATAIATRWLRAPNVFSLLPGPRHWEIFDRLISRERSPSGLVTDAHLAALAIERGAVLHSTDRDFRRWAELSSLDPLTS